MMIRLKNCIQQIQIKLNLHLRNLNFGTKSKRHTKARNSDSRETESKQEDQYSKLDSLLETLMKRQEPMTNFKISNC